MSPHSPLKVLFAASEIVPFAKTGGLADVVGALPQALSRLGCEVAIVMPKYRSVLPEKHRLTLVKRGLRVPMGMGDMFCDVWEGAVGGGRVKAYFIQNDRYFDRDQLYGTPEGDYPDNSERFAFFSKALLEMCQDSGWIPDIINLSDWQTGLAAAYQKTWFRKGAWANTRTLFTIHNIAYQGIFPKWVLPMTGLGWEEFRADRLEFYDQVNFLKAGLVYSDALNTVSPTYAKEIQTGEFGFGMDGVLRDRAADLHGILNGVDYDEWNPGHDPAVAVPYTARNLDAKAEAKKTLCAEMGLPYQPKTPLFGLVSRLTDQKGFDLLAEIIQPFIEMDIQLVILGTGEKRYQDLMTDMHAKYPGKLGLRIGFDNPLSRRIYAGSDLFLMPSRFEPCGLGQMISLRYGSIPVVRKTGGLADTITHVSSGLSTGNGFVFEHYTGEGFLWALREAAQSFQDQAAWRRLVTRAMGQDFSWNASAQRYLDLYREVLKKP
jgi:starch synthase